MIDEPAKFRLALGKAVSETGTFRREDPNHHTSVESALEAAKAEIEKLGVHPELTAALCHLQICQHAVSNWVDLKSGLITIDTSPIQEAVQEEVKGPEIILKEIPVMKEPEVDPEAVQEEATEIKLTQIPKHEAKEIEYPEEPEVIPTPKPEHKPEEVVLGPGEHIGPAPVAVIEKPVEPLTFEEDTILG